MKFLYFKRGASVMDAQAWAVVVIAVCVGLVLILAGVSKMHDPFVSRASVMAVSGEYIAEAKIQVNHANVLIAWVAFIEIGLGILLITGLYRTSAFIATIGLLAVFCAFLLALYAMPDAPSCGCLGAWTGGIQDARSQAMFGIVRNISLAALLIWTVPRLRSTSRLGFERPNPVQAGSPPYRTGFTILEVLVCIIVITVLLAILLPALKGAKDQSTRTVHLSNLRENLVAISVYTIAYQDRFPTTYALGDQPVSYEGNVLSWPLRANDYVMLNSSEWIVAMKAHGMLVVQDDHPHPRRTWYAMTSAAFAEPDVFIEDSLPTDSQMRTQRTTRTRHPASKGLLLARHPDVFGIPDENAVFSGKADGSAGKYIPLRDARPRPYSTVVGMPHPTIWTRMGLEGLDF